MGAGFGIGACIALIVMIGGVMLIAAYWQILLGIAFGIWMLYYVGPILWIMLPYIFWGCILLIVIGGVLNILGIGPREFEVFEASPKKYKSLRNKERL